MSKASDPLQVPEGYNKVIFLGCVNRAPELRRTPRGTAVCTFLLTVPRESVSGGEKTEDLLIDVVTFGALAEYCHTTLSLGTRVLVEGALVQRRWQEGGGFVKSKFEVIAQVARSVR